MWYALSNFLRKNSERILNRTQDRNMGRYPKFWMIKPYAKDATPAPRYVQKSIIPLTDAILPLLAKLNGKIERNEVFVIETAA